MVTLELSVDQPLALVAVRLCDVDPEGASSLITRGVLNLAHRDSREAPSLLDPGARYTIRLSLMSIGYQLAAGHRLRLAVSPTYWPWIWLVSAARGPVRVSGRQQPGAAGAVRFAGCAGAGLRERGGLTATRDDPPRAALELNAPRRSTSARDASPSTTIQIICRGGSALRRRDESSVSLARTPSPSWRVTRSRPKRTVSAGVEVGGDGWQAKTQVRSRLTSDEHTFFVETQVEAFDGAEPFFEKTWTAEIRGSSDGTSPASSAHDVRFEHVTKTYGSYTAVRDST